MNNEELSGPDSPDNTLQAEFDWETTAPSVAIVEAVASAANSDPQSLESLYECIDPDAVDMLFTESPDRPETSIQLTFTYHEFTVTVNSNGTVLVDRSGA